MNQSLNILRKDAEQMRQQLLMPLLTLALFTVLESKSWTSGPPLLLSSAAATNVLALLFCMTWVVLIISLVQAERLVGFNQFWTTRPYEWSKLIAAKCYFLLAFLYLPLVLSQAVLLHQARLSVVLGVPALVHNLILFTAVLVLPVVCAAALTRSIGQAMLVLLVFLATLVCLASSSALFQGLAPRGLLSLQIGLVAAVLWLALINQYRSRATRRSLRVLTAAPVMVLLLQVTVPGTSLSVHDYALPSGSAPISVQFDNNPLRAFGISSFPVRESSDPLLYAARSAIGDPAANLLVHLPLLVSGIGPGTSFALDAHRLTLMGANGYTWRSPWLPESGMIAPPQLSEPFPASSDFSIPRSVYDRLAGVSVSVGIDFALMQLRDQPPIHSALSTAGEAIPALGFCALDETYSVVNCYSAFETPHLFAIQTFRKIGTCTDPNARVDPASGAVGTVGADSVLPHVSPVDVTPIQLSAPTRAGFLCPGLPIAFVEKRVQRRLQVQMPVATIRLSDYIESVKTIK
jgi:hypothetical protein